MKSRVKTNAAFHELVVNEWDRINNDRALVARLSDNARLLLAYTRLAETTDYPALASYCAVKRDAFFTAQPDILYVATRLSPLPIEPTTAYVPLGTTGLSVRKDPYGPGVLLETITYPPPDDITNRLLAIRFPRHNLQVCTSWHKCTTGEYVAYEAAARE